MKTSNGWPLSSSVMLTNIVPSGVSFRIVVPRSLSGRDRFARRWRFSASASKSAFLSRSSSASSSAIVPLQLADARRLPRASAGCPSRSAFGLVGGAGGQHLVVARAVAVDGHALALQLVRELVDRAHVVDASPCAGSWSSCEIAESQCSWKAACMRMCHSGAISFAVTNTRCHFSGTSAKSTCPSLRDPLHQLVGVPAFALRDRDEVLVHVGHHHAGLVAHERHGEQRLEARRAAGDDRDRARRRDGRDVAVAEQLHRTDALARARRARTSRRDPRSSAPTRGTAPRSLGQPLALLLRLDVHELHHLAAELDALGRVVRRCRAGRARRRSP